MKVKERNLKVHTSICVKFICFENFKYGSVDSEKEFGD
jgi:hypothetical protein